MKTGTGPWDYRVVLLVVSSLGAAELDQETHWGQPESEEGRLHGRRVGPRSSAGGSCLLVGSGASAQAPRMPPGSLSGDRRHCGLSDISG